MRRTLVVQVSGPSSDHCSHIGKLNSDNMEGYLPDFHEFSNYTLTVETCINYIVQNLTKKITLDDLAELVGHDKFQVIRAFKRDLNTTPHAYILAERVSRAADLLRRGEPAAVVASEVGFVDQSHLIRYFKRHVGTTPKRFVSETGLNENRHRANPGCAVG